MLQTRKCWTALRLIRLRQISLKSDNKCESTNTNLFTPQSKVLFLLRWFSQNSGHSKFVGMCAEYFEQTDGNVENSFIYSFK